MLPTSTEIEYFIEVFQTRHISRAAIRLGVTQPTLTVSLKKLEAKLGSVLFHRTRQGLVPTEQGARLYSRAHALLEGWKDVSQDIRRSSSELEGRFKVGCHASVGAYALPGLLERLHREAPGIEIELVHDFSRKITESVVAYQVDLGFVVNPARHPDLVLRKLGDDRVLFWRKQGLRALPPRIFADLNLNQMRELLRKTSPQAFKDWRLISTPSLELIRTLTLSGQGVGIMPERVALADRAELVPHDPSLPIYADQICLAYRKDVLASRAGKELVRLASTHF